MTVYFVLYAVLLLFFIIRNKGNQSLLYCCAAVISVCLLGFRSKNVGTDTLSYVNCWNSENFIYLGDKTDFGFEQLLRLLRYVDSSDGFFLISTSLISMCGIMILINKFAKYKYDSLLFFLIGGASSVFYAQYFSMVRQACALSFVFIALVCLFSYAGKKRFYLFAAFFIIAVSIHGSSLFALPFILMSLADIHYNKKIVVFALLVTYVIGALQIIKISSLFSLVDLADSSLSKYGGYTVEEMAFGNEFTPSIINMGSLMYTLLCIYIMCFNNEQKYDVWYFKLFVMGTILNNLLTDNLMWSRLLLYFTILSILVIPNLARHTTFKYSRYVYILLVIFYVRKSVDIIVFMSQIPYTRTLVPYHTWF